MMCQHLRWWAEVWPLVDVSKAYVVEGEEVAEMTYVIYTCRSCGQRKVIW